MKIQKFQDSGTISQGTKRIGSKGNDYRVGQKSLFGERKYKDPYAQSLAERLFFNVTDKLHLTSPPTFTDGYGRTLNAEVPLKESAEGQELKRLGKTIKRGGEIALIGFGVNELAPKAGWEAIKLFPQFVKNIPQIVKTPSLLTNYTGLVSRGFYNHPFEFVGGMAGSILGEDLGSKTGKIVDNALEKSGYSLETPAEKTGSLVGSIAGGFTGVASGNASKINFFTRNRSGYPEISETSKYPLLEADPKHMAENYAERKVQYPSGGPRFVKEAEANAKNQHIQIVPYGHFPDIQGGFGTVPGETKYTLINTAGELLEDNIPREGAMFAIWKYGRDGKFWNVNRIHKFAKEEGSPDVLANYKSLLQKEFDLADEYYKASDSEKSFILQQYNKARVERIAQNNGITEKQYHQLYGELQRMYKKKDRVDIYNILKEQKAEGNFNTRDLPVRRFWVGSEQPDLEFLNNNMKTYYQFKPKLFVGKAPKFNISIPEQKTFNVSLGFPISGIKQTGSVKIPENVIKGCDNIMSQLGSGRIGNINLSELASTFTAFQRNLANAPEIDVSKYSWLTNEGTPINNLGHGQESFVFNDPTSKDFVLKLTHRVFHPGLWAENYGKRLAFNTPEEAAEFGKMKEAAIEAMPLQLPVQYVGAVKYGNHYYPMTRQQRVAKFKEDIGNTKDNADLYNFGVAAERFVGDVHPGNMGMISNNGKLVTFGVDFSPMSQTWIDYLHTSGFKDPGLNWFSHDDRVRNTTDIQGLRRIAPTGNLPRIGIQPNGQMNLFKNFSNMSRGNSLEFQGLRRRADADPYKILGALNKEAKARNNPALQEIAAKYKKNLNKWHKTKNEEDKAAAIEELINDLKKYNQ